MNIERLKMDLLKLPVWLIALAAIAVSAALIIIFFLPGDGLITPWGYVGRPSHNFGRTIAGKWNAGRIDDQSNGSLLTSAVLPDQHIKIDFSAYKFKAKPVVLLTATEATRVYVVDASTDYVEIKNQRYVYGSANGALAPDEPFWFAIISVEK